MLIQTALHLTSYNYNVRMGALPPNRQSKLSRFNPDWTLTLHPRPFFARRPADGEQLMVVNIAGKRIRRHHLLIDNEQNIVLSLIQVE